MWSLKNKRTKKNRTHQTCQNRNPARQSKNLQNIPEPLDHCYWHQVPTPWTAKCLRKSMGIRSSGISMCCKEVLSCSFVILCQGVTCTTWPLTRWWLLCGRSSLSRSFLQTRKPVQMSISTSRLSQEHKQVNQGWHVVLSHYRSRILNVKSHEQKNKKNRTHQTCHNRNPARQSKNVQNIPEPLGYGYWHQVPTPWTAKCLRKSMGIRSSGISMCCKEVLSCSFMILCQGHELPGLWPDDGSSVGGAASLEASCKHANPCKCPFPSQDWVKNTSKSTKDDMSSCRIIEAEFKIWSLKNKRTKKKRTHQTCPNRNPARQSKNVQNIPEPLDHGYWHQVPTPWTAKCLRKSMGIRSSGISMCCKEVLSCPFMILCQGVTCTTWPLTRWWLLCGRSSLSRSFLQTCKSVQMSISTSRLSQEHKQVNQGWHVVLSHYRSRILNVKSHEQKNKKNRTHQTCHNRNPARQSKNVQNIPEPLGYGYWHQVPTPWTAKCSRTSMGIRSSGISMCCREVLSCSIMILCQGHALPGLVSSLALSLWVDSHRSKASSRDAILCCIASNRSLAEAGNKSFWPTLQSSFSTVGVGCCQLNAAQSLIFRVLWKRGRLLCKCLVQNQWAIHYKMSGFWDSLHPAIFPTFCLSIYQFFCLPCVSRPTTDQLNQNKIKSITRNSTKSVNQSMN